jgi:hypothetical protein
VIDAEAELLGMEDRHLEACQTIDDADLYSEEGRDRLAKDVARNLASITRPLPATAVYVSIESRTL